MKDVDCKCREIRSRNSILKVQSLFKQQNEFKLKNISLDIKPNNIVGLIGENGSGKTSLIKCILMLNRLDNGSIYFKEEKRCREQNDQFGIVFDENPFFNEYTVDEANKICNSLYNRWDNDKFISLINEFNLNNRKKIKDFSRGMRMKFYLAIALSHHCEFLILDEATAGLDPIMRREILEIIKKFAKKGDNAVLISSHICSDLEKIADEIVLLNNGEIMLIEDKNILQERYMTALINEAQYKRFEKYYSKIIKRDDGYLVLINTEHKKNIENDIKLSVPTLDDITEIYIRGENV